MADAVAKVRKIKWKVNRYATFFKCLRLQSAFSPFLLHLFHPNKHHFYPDKFMCVTPVTALQCYSSKISGEKTKNNSIFIYKYRSFYGVWKSLSGTVTL